jgi:hypothetical protein
MPQVVGNSMLGAARSTGVNDWLAMASWGGLLQPQNTSSSTAKTKQTASSNTASTGNTSSLQASFQANVTATRRVQPFTHTQTIGQKSQIKENTAVNNAASLHPNDAFAQLHALYANPQTLADLQPARLSMSSYDFAKLQEEQQSTLEQRQSRSKMFQSTQEQGEGTHDNTEQTDSANESPDQHSEEINLGILAGYQTYIQHNEPASAPLHSIFG